MGQIQTKIYVPAIILAFSIAIIFGIGFISKRGYLERIRLINSLNIVGVPNEEIFKFIFWIFILSASIGYFIVLAKKFYIGIVIRAILFLTTCFLLAGSLFGTYSFAALPFALIFALILVIILGESIYYFGFVLKNKLAVSLLGFCFLWAIYSLYLIFSILISLLE